MSNRTKVAQLTSVHPAFDNRIFHKTCRTLAEAGYDVVLIAPGGPDEVVDGVRLRAVEAPRRRLDRWTRTIWQVYRAAREEDAAVYHFHDPELIPIGLLLKLRTGKRVIYDVHEDVPLTILSKPWLPPFVRRIVAACAWVGETVAARLLDAIVTATPSIGKKFPPEKTAVVQNYPLRRELVEVGGQPYAQRAALLAYVGYFTATRGARELVRALSLLPPALDGRFILGGICRPPELEEELRQSPGGARMEFPGWQSRDAVKELLSNARLGIVTLLPIPQYLESQPTKLFEYMAAGIPVVASDFPGWRQVVDGVGCGLLVDPTSPQDIARAIEWLLEHPAEAEAMGQRGQQAVRTRYNWDHEAATLLSLYGRLIGQDAISKLPIASLDTSPIE